MAACSLGEAHAQDVEVTSLATLFERLGRVEGLRARYREQKRITLLKQPLRSEGVIWFARPDLLLRSTEQPEPSTLLIEGTKLELADASGTRRIDTQASPVLRQFVLSFVYVLSGDQAALAGIYVLRFERVASGGWRLLLTPKQAELARVVKQIEVFGKGASVERMVLDEAQGDSTTMEFFEVDLGQRFDAAARQRIFRLP